MEEIGSPVGRRIETFLLSLANIHFRQIDERAPSPETVLLKGSQENMGPSAEADAEFEKELGKMLTDVSAESRRVDRRTALALWESAALPTGFKKKRVDGFEEDGDTSASTEEPVMNFTFITKKGKQQQVSFRFSYHKLLLTAKQPRLVNSPSLRSQHWLYRHVQPRCRTKLNNSS